MAFKNARSNEVAPTIVEEMGRGGSLEQTITHPAFAQISVSRVSVGGDGIHLYDSDFGHNSVVSIELKSSSLHRGLNRDWHHNEKEIVHFYLSESQWATFVSSFNSGNGTPCTLTWTNTDGGIPGIPATDRVPQFQKEMGQMLEKSVSELDVLRKQIEDLGLSKKKSDELLRQLAQARQDIVSNMPFIQNSFDEHMEDTVEKAKQEFQGWRNAEVIRRGLNAIASDENPVLRIE